MHYVPGIPLSRPGGMPNVSHLITGQYESELRYPEIRVFKKPGESFSYSGGGFLVLEHLLQIITGHTNVQEDASAL